MSVFKVKDIVKCISLSSVSPDRERFLNSSELFEIIEIPNSYELKIKALSTNVIFSLACASSRFILADKKKVIKLSELV